MLRLTLAVMLLSGAPFAAQRLDGLWRSEGYGYVFEIKGPTLKAFEMTTQTCRPSFTARRQGASTAGRDATYRTSYGEVYFVRTGGGDRRLLHNDGSASDIRIDRLAKMPPECVPPTGNTPLDNFNVFTHTWAENYISFDLKHADWDGIVAQSRPKITDRTSPAALFEILQAMIQPFGDAHTFIHAQDLKRDFQGLRAGTDRAAKDVVGDAGLRQFRSHGMTRLLAVTDAAYLHGPLRKFCNDQVQFAKIDAGTGYLRVVSFSGYSKGGFAEGLSALEEGLDQIFSDTALKALVIDVRINFGGEDPYGLSIASRLALSEYLAYTKYARSSAVEHDRWTPGDPSVVRPVSRPGFRGPVVELTGPLTISAGETFTQALMGRVPHITRIGENTQGVFSDVLVRRMPNGWVFGLPNEVYRTTEGIAFDGPGIPPDITVPVFAAEDVAAGKDPAMAKALEILRSVQ